MWNSMFLPSTSLKWVANCIASQPAGWTVDEVIHMNTTRGYTSYTGEFWSPYGHRIQPALLWKLESNPEPEPESEPEPDQVLLSDYILKEDDNSG